MAYIFTTQAQDTFQRANENPLSDGGKWTQIVGDDPAKIVSNACEPTDTTNYCGAVYTGIVWPANSWVSVKVASVNLSDSETVISLYLRFVNDGNNTIGYLLQVDAFDGTFTIDSFVTASTLTSGSVTVANGDTFLFGFYNSTWLFYKNGILLSTGTDTDSANAGVAGFDLFASVAVANVQLSNFSGGLITESGGSGSGQINAGFGFSTDMPGSTAADTGGTAIVTRKTAIMTTKFGSRIIG